jgi:hypothetical protein
MPGPTCGLTLTRDFAGVPPVRAKSSGLVFGFWADRQGVLCGSES